MGQFGDPFALLEVEKAGHAGPRAELVVHEDDLI